MKAGFISLGCSKNLVDTEVMLGIIQQNGIELVNDPAEADILIVNTCQDRVYYHSFEYGRIQGARQG